MKTPKPLRWLLVLWLAFAPASHAYLYVSDNPWTKIDPNGLTERAEGPNSAGDFVDGNGYIHILSGQAPGDIGGPQAKALEVVLNRNHPANEKRAQQNFQNSVPNGSPLAGIWSGHYLNDAGDEVKNQPRIDWLTVGYLGLMEALGKQGPATPTTTAPGQAAIDDAEEVNNANKANAVVTPGTSAKTTQAVQAYEVGTYGDMKPRSVGDGLDIDHQPSKAALLQAAEEEKGLPLTKAEKQAIINSGTSVAVPKPVHQAGPTFGGKNTPAQIQADSQNLPAAAARDSNAMVQNAPPADKAAAQKAADQVQAQYPK